MNPIEFRMKKKHKIEPVPVDSEEIKFWEKEFEAVMRGAGWEDYMYIINPIKK